MDAKSRYDPWFICTTPDGQRYPQYTQRTSKGFRCCQFPDVQDIIYTIDHDKNLITSVRFFPDMEITDTRVYDYLKMYETIVKTCDYFTKIDSLFTAYSTNSQGLVLFMQENYSELYDYVVIQIRIFYNFFQQGSLDTIYYIQFKSETLTCGMIVNNVAGPYLFQKNNYIPHYLSYDEFDDLKAFKYVPFCASSATNVGLNNYSLTDNEYSILSVRNNINENEPCTQSECNVVSKYYSHSGQNILGKDQKNYNKGGNKSILFITLISLCSFLFILICIFGYKAYTSHKDKTINENQYNTFKDLN